MTKPETAPLVVRTAPAPHWVGDGFPVRSLFSYERDGERLSPFLLLDYAGPHTFDATDRRRGVGPHPHRGFETVTIVYQGAVAHRDSTGDGGILGPGDVQWMTAGSGIVHQEFHSDAFARTGGVLEMVQLWVNLPAAAKMTPPRYQAIVAAAIPQLPLPGDAGTLRLIAGDCAGHTGPARTFSPLRLLELRLAAGRRLELAIDPAWNAALVVLRGRLRISRGAAPAVSAQAAQSLILSGESALAITADTDAVALVLDGEPLREPIVGHGPFVMNTADEIATALADFRSGRFGQMSP